MDAGAGSPETPPRFRWGPGLWIFAIACLLWPWLVFPTHQYVKIGPYGAMGVAAVHFWGHLASMALAVTALLALLLACVHPRIVLWRGLASWRQAVGVYMSVAFIAGLLWVETYALGHATYALEARALQAVFDQTRPGDTLASVKASTGSRVFGGRLHFGGADRPEIAGQRLPAGQYVELQIHPGVLRVDRMVIQTTPARDQGGSTDTEFFSRRVLKTWLVLDNGLHATR